MDEVHRHGAKILMQILHSGRYAKHDNILGVSSIRYQAQTASYLLLLTPRYPNSSPALDPSGAGEEADG